jgi:hypothetical protein
MNNSSAQLNDEDMLRLNVLAQQQVLAIRIDESHMTLIALTTKGEASIQLNPTASDTVYLKRVREFLSEKFFGMPGGYPVHISRWARMGSAHSAIDKLLLLGEPEAVVAAACSAGLTVQIAHSVWWSLQSTEVARSMLRHESIQRDSLGSELAQFLLEYLPIEEQSLAGMETVRLCLLDNLVSELQRAELWERAKRKNYYYVGFLNAGDEAIPLQEESHPALAPVQALLSAMIEKSNSYARGFLYFLQAAGRRWLRTLQMALRKPIEPDVVVAIFMAIEQQVKVSEVNFLATEFADACNFASSWCDGDSSVAEFDQVLATLPNSMLPQLKAYLVLMQMGERTVIPVFRGRDATGSVMRKHLQPVSSVLQRQIQVLLD